MINSRLVLGGTFEEPNRYPGGIVDVFVNGKAVIRNGEPSGIRAGRVLRVSN